MNREEATREMQNIGSRIIKLLSKIDDTKKYKLVITAKKQKKMKETAQEVAAENVEQESEVVEEHAEESSSIEDIRTSENALG